jgi:hypothetical protein
VNMLNEGYENGINVHELVMLSDDKM